MNDKAITARKVLAHTATYYGTTSNHLTGPSRKRTVAIPRMVAMYMTRELTLQSLRQIGKTFARDHSTVHHAIIRIADLREVNAGIRYAIDQIRYAIINSEKDLPNDAASQK